MLLTAIATFAIIGLKTNNFLSFTSLYGIPVNRDILIGSYQVQLKVSFLIISEWQPKQSGFQ